MPLFRFGPSGGTGGDPIDDELQGPAGVDLTNSFIVEITVNHGRFIDAVQFSVRDKTTSQVFELPRHGGRGGIRDTFTLPRNEFITSVSGVYGRFVDSMTIRTNQRTLGPFGGPGGDVDFLYQAPNIPTSSDSAIIGLFCRAGRFLDAIGVILLRPR